MAAAVGVALEEEVVVAEEEEEVAVVAFLAEEAEVEVSVGAVDEAVAEDFLQVVEAGEEAGIRTRIPCLLVKTYILLVLCILSSQEMGKLLLDLYCFHRLAIELVKY